MEPPPGSLNRIDLESSSDLQNVQSGDLVAELLRRLRAGEGLAASETAAETDAVLGMELERATDVFNNRFSRCRISELFCMTNCFSGRAGEDISGATFVELGCGSINPLAALFTLVMLGAARGVGVDLDPPQAPHLVAHGLARCCSYLLSEPRLLVGDYPITRQEIARNLEGFDMYDLWCGNLSGINDSRLELKQESVLDMSLADGVADLVYSVSFLEHVAPLEEAVAEMARITRKGGMGHHTIDGFDHMHYQDPERHPLDFLRIGSDELLVRDCNRLRPLQFIDLFERHGFEVVDFQAHTTLPIDDALRATFAEQFRELPEEVLGIAQAGIQVRKH